MADLETDYLVVGAGVSGMGFADVMTAKTDAEILIVDKRHHPAGHWNDAYPFVRLHQPAAVFGVDSTTLLDDQIDDSGPNKGFYQLASAPEIVAYYGRVLHALEASGKVRFMPATEYCGTEGDAHVLRSTITGRVTTVATRRRVVDTTYQEPSIPSRHTPAFGLDAGVRVVPPNALVDLGDVPSGFTVLGAGKTAMDAVTWLLDQGVAPDAIRWVRPTEPWLMRRMASQPLMLIGPGFMNLQAQWIKAAAQAEDADDMARRLEAGGVFARIDPSRDAGVFKGPTLSDPEIEALRSIENVVRLGRVLHVGTGTLKLQRGELPSDPGHVYVDCTASALRDVPIRPIFEPGRITLQLATLGNTPFSSATVGAVEALVEGDDARNAMCASIGSFGPLAEVAAGALRFLNTMPHRLAHPDVSAWLAQSRLNAANVPPELKDDPEVKAGMSTMFEHLGAAMENLARITAAV
jgi:hypothetical protein